jgi:hypothetical protein
MLRAASYVWRAGGVRRSAFPVASVASPSVRSYASSTRTSSLGVPLSAGLSSSFAVPSALVANKRGYTRKPNPHDSNTEDTSNTFFDVQDVDADRLTHFYWDSNDDADSPYDAALLDSLLGEGEADEWSGESPSFVDERDQQLLDVEYLK